MSFVTYTGTDPTGSFKRVLCAGDSITVGFSNAPPTGLVNGGYRLRLLQLALADNKDIYLTGSKMNNSTGMSDPWHEGVSGEVITQIQARINALPASPAPNVVLLHSGTNDFYQYVKNGTPAISAVQTRHTAMMNDIFTKWPSTTVIVVTLGPWYNPTGCTGCDGEDFATMSAMAERTSFNSYITNLPANYAGGSKSSQIKVVDLAAVFTTANYYGDGLHPNEFGYQLMAWRWWSVLKPLV